MNINFEMPRYKSFRPTSFDGHIHVDSIEDFFIVYQRNRDSDILVESNFDCILKFLGGESEKVQVHRFGHWGCGWFEMILAHPDLEEQVAEVAVTLENYPVFDDIDYGNRCSEAAIYEWEHMRWRDRIDYCKKAGISHLAARHEEVPDRVLELLLENTW